MVPLPRSKHRKVQGLHRLEIGEDRVLLGCQLNGLLTTNAQTVDTLCQTYPRVNVAKRMLTLSSESVLLLLLLLLLLLFLLLLELLSSVLLALVPFLLLLLLLS